MIFKMPHVTSQLYSVVQMKLHLMNHLPRNHYHYTVNNRLRKRQTGTIVLACMQVSNYKPAFTPMHLVFLYLDTHNCYLGFKLLDDNSNVHIQRVFYLQLSIKY